MMTIHPQSIGLQHVLETVTILKQILQVCRGMDEDELNAETKEMMKSVRGETNLLKMDTQWKELQQHVDHVLDRDMNKGSEGNTWGFKQVSCFGGAKNPQKVQFREAARCFSLRFWLELF